MICRGCGNDKKLIKAHIIPESFFVGLRDEDRSPLIITDTGDYPKRSPIGVYDKTILCHECEQIFQEIDAYGQDLLLQQKSEEIKKNGSAIAYKIPEVDYNLIKLFFISILWRASISTHVYYHLVKLGKFEQTAHNFLLQNNPGTPEEFSFLLAKFTNDKFGTAMLNPHRERWDGINYYRFYLFGYILHIKVDKRHTPKTFSQFILHPGESIIVIARDVSHSKELQVMHNVVHKSK